VRAPRLILKWTLKLRARSCMPFMSVLHYVDHLQK
jgi:hypothetical protein